MNVRDMLAEWYIYTDRLPILILALLLLIVGWLAAKKIGKVTEAALKKTSFDDKLFSGYGSRKYSSEKIIGKIVYYLLLVFVWIIFFNMLNLSYIASPLVHMLSSITGAIPNVLKAALILLFAWVIATVLRKAFEKGATALHLPDRLAKWKLAKTEIDGREKVAKIAKALFYFVLLLFLPGVLGALQMEGVSEPVAGILTTFLSFIPKLFAAALIVFIGWLLAKLVRDILTNFLKSIGSETLGERLGMKGSLDLAGIVGNIVFILILIPTIITALEKLDLQGVSAPAIAMLEKVVALIPNIAVAVVLILAGIWLGKWVEKLVAQMLWRLRFDGLLHQLGIGGAVGPESAKYSLSQLVGMVVKIVIVLLFTVEALQIVGLDFLVTLASAVLAYLPMLFAALVILGVGLYVGNLVERIVRNVVKESYARTLAVVAKYAVFAVTVFMALDQLGVAHSIVNAAFILLLGGLALAFGLSFGLGGKDFAAKYLRKLDNKLDEEGNQQ
ncbi:mechanosensitive ion channel [Neobacillus rhizophilus]|uniref:Mechanosensitive ion channel n=1 Tax=Neobacillus rhizophilus TaxID=2833579 RepID=A0A942U569_9BACI|nr:mechanosensitive ion channel [Neobacillus rhizophilus]MBS4212627.1 mechanosensitive ion channel [Neobacillus rhizophilus]